MLKKRMIFTLLYADGFFMLSRNFRLQKVGDLQWLKKNYNFSKISFSIDELIILDVSREERDEESFLDIINSLTEECFIPIAAGGGINSLEQARQRLYSGADKIVINSLIASDQELIHELASEFGSQCIVVSVDVKKINENFTVWTQSGQTRQKERLDTWLSKIIKLPVGEIYLNSMDQDGTGQGYDVELLKYLPTSLMTPIILAGGAGKYQHFARGLLDAHVDAVATAHLFNFVGDGLEMARNKLLEDGFDLARWNVTEAINMRNIFSKADVNENK
jgi:cyclase